METTGNTEEQEGQIRLKKSSQFWSKMFWTDETKSTCTSMMGGESVVKERDGS